MKIKSEKSWTKGGQFFCFWKKGLFALKKIFFIQKIIDLSNDSRTMSQKIFMKKNVTTIRTFISTHQAPISMTTGNYANFMLEEKTHAEINSKNNAPTHIHMQIFRYFLQTKSRFLNSFFYFLFSATGMYFFFLLFHL